VQGLDSDYYNFAIEIHGFFPERDVDFTGFDDDFIQNNIDIMPLFFVHLLNFQDGFEPTCHDQGMKAKRFNVLPMNTLGRHSIPYGNIDMFNDVKKIHYPGYGEWRVDVEGESVPMTRKIFHANHRHHWRNVMFKMEKLTSAKYEINDGLPLTTNGVKASLLLRERETNDGKSEFKVYFLLSF